MLKKFYILPSTIARLRSGTAGPYLDDFVAHLDSLGYSPRTIRMYVTAVEHFCDWLLSRGATVEGITTDSVTSFIKHAAKCNCTEKYHGGRISRCGRVNQSVRRFFEFLCKKGVVTAAQEPEPPKVVTDFEDWMRRNRGTASGTLQHYRRVVTAFLDDIGADMTRLNCTNVRGFIFRRARAGFRARARNDVKALRMFLRFLASTDQCAPTLEDAVPAIASWSLATLPRYIRGDEVERVIASCDPTTPIGLRDRAILLLLARLGLRAGDIRLLKLADIDWADGTLLVEGKSRRQTRLPLPQDAGDAIAAYIERGRPSTPFQQVFLRHKTPCGPLRRPSISSIVRLALIRARVDAPSYGAHLFRHSAAYQMLSEGVPMEQIRSVLRHASLETTALYAKVDTGALKTIAQPWPEVMSC